MHYNLHSKRVSIKFAALLQSLIIKLSISRRLARAMHNSKQNEEHIKTDANDPKINAINAELSARFQKYRSHPTSVIALIQILQQKMRILAVNSAIPISYCFQFQKSIVDKIRKLPQMNSSHVDYIQSLYDKQIENLQNKSSIGNKVFNLMNQRSQILKDVKVILVKEKLSNNAGDKRHSLNLSYLGQNISKLRELSLGIIQNLSLWKSSLSSSGQDQYSKLILQCISKDVEFLRLTPLRKFLQFSSSQDPLFLYSMKKFWKLQLNTNYNSRAIMKLFQVSNSYKKRLLNAQKFMKCYDPNVVIYDYPFEATDQEENTDYLHMGQNTGSMLYQKNKQSESSNLPSISQKHISLKKNIRSQTYQNEPRSLETSPKKTFELLRPIIEEAKQNKYSRSVNINHINQISPGSFETYKSIHQPQTQSIKDVSLNRKYRAITQAEANDIKESINRRYSLVKNGLKDFNNNIQGKHKIFAHDKKRKLKPIFNHNHTNHHQNPNTSIHALIDLPQVNEDTTNFYQSTKNQEGKSSIKTIKIPNTLQQKHSNPRNLKRHSLNAEPQSLDSKNQFIGEKSHNQKIYNQMNSKNYQTEDQYDKQNFLMGSDQRKKVQLQAIKKKQFQLEKALKRYEMQDMCKKSKSIGKNSQNLNRIEDPLSYGVPSSLSSKIRIKTKNSYQKSNRSKKDTISKVQQFNSMDQEYEESDYKIQQASWLDKNHYDRTESYVKPQQNYTPERGNTLISLKKRNQQSKDEERFGLIDQSLEKSQKSTNRQNGKIKIIPMIYKNGEMSPATKRSYMQVQSPQKQSSKLEQEEQPNKLVEQKMQSVKKLPQEKEFQQFQSKQKSFSGLTNKKLESNLSKLRFGGQQGVVPENLSPYSQYLNDRIKEDDSNEPDALLVKSLDQENISQPLNHHEPNTKKNQQEVITKQQMQISSSRQKQQIPNKQSGKNLVETIQNHNTSNFQNHSHIQNQHIKIYDHQVLDHQISQSKQRLSPAKVQTLSNDKTKFKSELENLVEAKIQQKSKHNKTISSSKNHLNIKDPEIVKEGERNSNKQSLDVNELPNRASSLLSNRSGNDTSNRAGSLLSNRSENDTQKSSLSKSSSMKLESQTSQAMNQFNSKSNQKTPESINEKSSEPSFGKKEIGGKVKNEVRDLNRKLETIQYNESYGQMRQNSQSPQHKNRNLLIIPSNGYQNNKSTQDNKQKSPKHAIYPNQGSQIQAIQPTGSNQQSLNKTTNTNPLSNHYLQIQKLENPSSEQQKGKTTSSLGKNPIINNTGAQVIVQNINRANRPPQVNNQHQEETQSPRNQFHLNQSNKLHNPSNQSQDKFSFPHQTTNDQPLIQQAKPNNLYNIQSAAEQKTKQKTKDLRQNLMPEMEKFPTQNKQTIMNPRNVSQMSVTAEKGSQYKYKEKDQQLGLSISQYSDSQYDPNSDEEVNKQSKDRIAKKQENFSQKQGDPAFWVNPNKKAVQNNLDAISRPENDSRRMISTDINGKQGMTTNINETNKVQNQNKQPFTYKVAGNSNNIQSSNKKQQLPNTNQMLENKNSNSNMNSNSNSTANFNKIDQCTISDQVEKINSISHEYDRKNQAIKLNTISQNNTIMPTKTIPAQQSISQPMNKTFTNLSSIQSDSQYSKSNFIGNNSTLNFNINNNYGALSSEEYSRKNTFESNKEPNIKPPLNSNLYIENTDPKIVDLTPPNSSLSNLVKVNQQTSNQTSHPENLNNAVISETNSDYVTENSQNKLKALAQMANSITKCVFQSKSLEKSQLRKFLLGYKLNQKIIEQIDQGYFSHRQLYLNLCLLNDEVISVILSHPAFIGSQRIVFIVLFKVVSEKYLDLSSRLLATTIKYIFYNDPCQNVICLKPKDEYLDQKDKQIEKNFLQQVKNIKGKIKNKCFDPLLTGTVCPSVFEEKNYIVGRKDLTCKNDEIYMNNIEFQVFIIGKQLTKIPQKVGKLQLSSNYRATVQKMFTITQKNSFVKVFKSKAQLFQYTEEEQVGDFDNQKVLGSIKQNQNKDLYLYERQLCMLAPEVKYSCYGGVYYFLLEDKRAWYWEKNNVGYFIVKCNVQDRTSQQSGNDMVSEISPRSQASSMSPFGKKYQKSKSNQYFYIYIDYIYESQDLVEGAGLIRQNIEAKNASEVLRTDQQHKNKIITVPCYESTILADRYNSDGFIFNFKMNLSWQNYIKGIRTMPEEQIATEYMSPFYIGVIMKDENDIMRFVAGTFVSSNQQKTQQ